RIVVEPRRPRLERDGGAPGHLVEAVVSQQYTFRTQHPRLKDASLLALEAAHLEYIGEIAPEDDGQLNVDRTIAVVVDTQSLISRALPEKGRADDVQRILLEDQPPTHVDVGIGQIRAQDRVVVTNGRPQQQRRHPVEAQLEPREEAGVFVKDAVM